MLKLVLLPGMDGTGLLFKPFIEAFQGASEIIVVAYPVNQPLNYEALDKWVTPYLPTEGDYVILGESFSGPIALSIAASKPRGLVGLILCCTFAQSPVPALTPFRSILSRLPVKCLPARVIHYFLLGKFGTTELCQALDSVISSVSIRTMAARANAVLSVNVSDKLPVIDLPVLYLRSTHDRLVSAKSTYQISSALKSCQVIEIQASHCLLQVKPFQVAQHIKKYMGELQLTHID